MSASRLIPVATLMALIPALTTTAAAQASKVVPISVTSKDASNSSYLPFVYDRTRVQQVWKASAVTTGAAVLNSINFRRDGSSKQSYAKIDIPAATISIGHTSVSPMTMSTTFSKNITGTMTTIHSGKYTVPASSAPSSGPAPFSIKYPLTTPYVYKAQTGNFIMEWVHGSGNAQAKRQYLLDAVLNNNGGGAILPFGSFGTFSAKDNARFEGDGSKLTPGGSLDLTMSGFTKAYASHLFFGVSTTSWNGLTLPFDLSAIGAPGNKLYTGLDVVLPFTLKQSGSTYGASFNFTLPKSPTIVGQRIYGQTYHADAKANAAGLVASHGLEIIPGSSSPVTQILGQSSTTQATGFFLFNKSYGGPVVEFVGAIK